MKKLNLVLAAAVSAATLAACGGGSSGTASTGTGATATAGARYLNTIQVPGIAAGGKSFTYDGGQVVDGRFYLTDRNAKGVDVVDTTFSTVISQISGNGPTAFAGQAVNPDGSANNDKTGPNSLQKVGTNKLYVTDVNSVKVIDTSTLQVTKVIPINNASGQPTGFRTDGSCFDAVHHVFMGINSTDNFVTWINTDTDKVIARYDYDQSIAPQGLEVCTYVPSLDKFFLNNDGNNNNLNGQLDSWSYASIAAGQPVLDTPIPLGDCNPNGLALGPNNEAVIACDPSAEAVEGKPLITLIVDLKNRSLFPAIPFGGSDLASYDPVTNRYFLGSRNWQKSGKFAAALPKDPSLGIIDAATHQALAPVAAGKGAHTAVVDSANGKVYVPYTPTSGSTDFANGGIAVYSTK